MLAETVVTSQIEDWLRLMARANTREPVRGLHQEAGRQGGIVSGVVRRSRVAEARAAGQPSPYLRGPRSECVHGHKLTGANLVIRGDGRRACRECRRRWHRAENLRLKAEGVARREMT